MAKCNQLTSLPFKGLLLNFRRVTIDINDAQHEMPGMSEGAMGLLSRLVAIRVGIYVCVCE